MWNWETWEKLGREETLGKYEVVVLRSSWEAHSSKLEGVGFAESVRKQWALLPLKPLKAGVLKGLAFSYLKVQVTENALDCFVSVFVWTVLLWVEGRYMVSAELKSRCSYDVACSLENAITYTVNGGKPSVYFGEEIEVPWLFGVFWWLTAFLPAYSLQAGACTQLDPSTHKCPGADHGLPSVAACPVMFHGLEEASMVS